VPNLIGLIGLRHVVIAETRAYFSRDLDAESEPQTA
jgi:AGCS family alanine or glycine:cation symporter